MRRTGGVVWTQPSWSCRLWAALAWGLLVSCLQGSFRSRPFLRLDRWIARPLAQVKAERPFWLRAICAMAFRLWRLEQNAVAQQVMWIMEKGREALAHL